MEQLMTKKQAKNMVGVKNVLRMFDLALVYYNTTNMSWKKCIKKAEQTSVWNPMWRDL